MTLEVGVVDVMDTIIKIWFKVGHLIISPKLPSFHGTITGKILQIMVNSCVVVGPGLLH